MGDSVGTRRDGRRTVAAAASERVQRAVISVIGSLCYCCSPVPAVWKPFRPRISEKIIPAAAANTARRERERPLRLSRKLLSSVIPAAVLQPDRVLLPRIKTAYVYAAPARLLLLFSPRKQPERIRRYYTEFRSPATCDVVIENRFRTRLIRGEILLHSHLRGRFVLYELLKSRSFRAAMSPAML